MAALDTLVADLDAYFRVPEVRNDDWAPVFDQVYETPYWRDYAEPGYPGRWNGLMVRGAESVDAVATCVFPSDEIVASLAPRTFLFSEHPLDLADEPGFLPLARETFATMRERGVSFYHVHAPLDMHPEVSPSRLCAAAVGLRNLEEYFPIADGIPGGAAVSGDSELTLDGLAAAFATYLGDEIPVRVLTRPRERASRVTVAAGGGAQREILEAALERGSETYVTGNAATRCRLDFVQAEVRAFRELADDRAVALIDATHYGMKSRRSWRCSAGSRRAGCPPVSFPTGRSSAGSPVRGSLDWGTPPIWRGCAAPPPSSPVSRSGSLLPRPLRRWSAAPSPARGSSGS